MASSTSSIVDLEPWSVPTSSEIASTTIDKFRVYVTKRYQISLPDYWALHAWSVSPDGMGPFWEAVWDFTGVVGDRGRADEPLFNAKLPMWPSRHFSKSTRVNWAENMLRSHSNAKSTTANALVCLTESEDPQGYASLSLEGKIAATHMRTLTYADLEREVCYASEALRSWGVGKGDAVAGYISNNSEAVIMVLAASAVGAMWSSSAPEVAPPSVLDRFEQMRPKVLLVSDRYRFAGKLKNMEKDNEALVGKLRACGLEKVVVVGQLDKDREPRKMPDLGDGTFSWGGFLGVGKRTGKTESTFERMALDEPLWVLYSSGTTGKPKAIVHSQGGMLLSSKMANSFHTAITGKSVMLQAASSSWMMWNSQVSILGQGATILAYDGSPLHPRSIFWDLLEGYVPNQLHDLSSLKAMLTAGAPLKPELYHFVKEGIKPLFLCNGSGGTDICGAFVSGVPSLPIYPGEISAPILGMKVEAFNASGYPIPPGTDEQGELVCSAPFPNCPKTFLGKDGEQRYKAAYFEFWEGIRSDAEGGLVWTHGDFIEVTNRGGVKILGRSDGVLNPGGVRFGSAELYAIVESMKDSVDDCIAVSQRLPDGDERVVLFVQTVKGRRLDEGMRRELRERITSGLSRRHVPAVMVECKELPYTSNMKRLEIPVKKIINGTPLEKISTASMLNPHTLGFFVNHPDLSLKGLDTRRAKAKL